MGCPDLADWFTADVETGLDGTDVRAGVIKVASETELTPMEERILEAAARAHAATGVPILTHSLARVRMGEQQAAVLERFGVDPGRVVIGDAVNDVLRALLDRIEITEDHRVVPHVREEYQGYVRE